VSSVVWLHFTIVTCVGFMVFDFLISSITLVLGLRVIRWSMLLL